MRVLTFGWDFPPMKNGGLGVACFGLTRELIEKGIEIVFVLPKKQETIGSPRFIFAEQAEKVTIRPVESSLLPYHQTNTTVDSIEIDVKTGNKIRRRRTILDEIHRFAHQASLIAKQENYDVIHAHDWTSYLAGVAAKKSSGKPLVLHAHATAFDQAAGDNVDPAMYQIESEGFSEADLIVAVSDYTKQLIVKRYGVAEQKVVVVHNGCDTFNPPKHTPTLTELRAQGKKVVLYHGRITVQKGVDYFVRAAKKVVEVDPNVVFVISGWGDMTNQIIELVGELKLSRNIVFAGALWDDDRDRMYQSVDLVVMPSVSEPFGLVPLEAILHGSPSLISKQSGVSEVLNHTLKVDFWDVDEMANQILATLRYKALHQQLKVYGREEINKLSWREAAFKMINIYQTLVRYV